MGKRKTKRFDAVAWMRQRRAEIDREDHGLTWNEKSLRTLNVLQGDPVWERLKKRVLQPRALVHGRSDRQER